MKRAIQTEIEERGVAIVESVLPPFVVAHLLTALTDVAKSSSISHGGGIFAIRNLLDVVPAVQELASSAPVRALVESILGEDCFPVRGILFDKVPNANWKVPWHQDVTIAVQERLDSEGFGPWSVKAGVLHVQPPTKVLEHMLSIRLHLDPCGEDNGALRVIPGSHRHGRVPENQIATLSRAAETVCTVGTGGALLMRPLLLHASSPSRVPAHRRVIHLDFANLALPSGLRWFSEAA